MTLVANNWYSVTISPFTAPPWSTPPPTIQSTIGAKILAAAALYVFCVDDSGGVNATIAFDAGTAVGYMSIPQACVTIVSTPTMDTTMLVDGTTWYSIRTGTGAWLFYDGGSIRSLTVPGTLSTFLS